MTPLGKASKSLASSSDNEIQIRSKIVVAGFGINAKPNEPMKDVDGTMRALVLNKINKVFGSELTEEDLPVAGDEPRVVYTGYKLPSNYQELPVGKLFDKDRVTVHFSPHPDRIIETRREKADDAAKKLQGSLDAMRAEYENTKNEMAAQGLRLDLALGKKVGKKPKKSAQSPSESDQLLASIEAMVNEKLNRRDEEWGMKVKHLEMKVKHLESELGQEREERKLGDERLLKDIQFLRLRILLDKTRECILRDLQFNTWAELSRNRQVEDYVINNLRDPHRPTDNAIRWCLQPGNWVREAGNRSAHEAEEHDIRAAVLSMPNESEDQKHLRSLFTYVYQGACL